MKKSPREAIHKLLNLKEHLATGYKIFYIQKSVMFSYSSNYQLENVVLNVFLRAGKTIHFQGIKSNTKL